MTSTKESYLQLKKELQKTIDDYWSKINKLEKEKEIKTGSIKERMAKFAVFAKGDFVEVMNEISDTVLFAAIIDKIDVSDSGEIGYGLVAADIDTLEPLTEFNHIHLSKQFRANRLRKIENVSEYLNGMKKDDFAANIKKLEENYREVKNKLFDLYIKNSSDIKIGDEVFVTEPSFNGVLFGGKVYNINISINDDSMGELEYVIEFHNTHVQSQYRTYKRSSIKTQKEKELQS